MFYIYVCNSPLRSQVSALPCLVHKTCLFGKELPLFPSPTPMATYATERKLQWIFQQEVTATLGMILCGFMIKFWLSLLWMEEQGRCRESGGGVGWGGERCSDLGESGGIWWSLWWFSPLLSHCKTQNCVEVRKPLTGYSSPLPEGESGVILMMF